MGMGMETETEMETEMETTTETAKETTRQTRTLMHTGHMSDSAPRHHTPVCSFPNRSEYFLASALQPSVCVALLRFALPSAM